MSVYGVSFSPLVVYCFVFTDFKQPWNLAHRNVPSSKSVEHICLSLCWVINWQVKASRRGDDSYVVLTGLGVTMWLQRAPSVLSVHNYPLLRGNYQWGSVSAAENPQALSRCCVNTANKLDAYSSVMAGPGPWMWLWVRDRVVWVVQMMMMMMMVVVIMIVMVVVVISKLQKWLNKWSFSRFLTCGFDSGDASLRRFWNRDECLCCYICTIIFLSQQLSRMGWIKKTICQINLFEDRRSNPLSPELTHAQRAIVVIAEHIIFTITSPVWDQ